VGLAVVALVLLWNLPGLRRDMRVVWSILACILTGLLLVGWFALFSGLRWWVRWGLPLALAVVGVTFLWATVDEVQFSGDMVPLLHFVWQRGGRLDERGGTGAVTNVDLSGGRPEDFPGYRGRNRDGVVIGPPLARSWDKEPARLWRQPVGGGYAGFAVVGHFDPNAEREQITGLMATAGGTSLAVVGSLLPSGGPVAYTLEQRRGREAVVCYDAATGEQRWAHEYDAHFQESMGGPGPRTTPTVAGGLVYSLGATGKLTCLDAGTGHPEWEADVLANDGNLPWGMSGSPLVAGKLVIVNPGVQSAAAANRGLVAYNRHTGVEVWAQGNVRAAYASPQLMTLAGRPQVVVFDGEGLAGYDADGKGELWRFGWVTPPQFINVAQPVAVGDDRVFITSGYGVGCALVKVAESRGKWSAQPVWKNKAMACKFSSPVLYQDHLYGLDDGVLACVAVADGAQKWRNGRAGQYGHGQVLLAGDLLVVLSEGGELALVEATPERFRELGRFPAVEGDKTWNPFALAAGRAYVRNHREMACFDLAR
jgi:outer membrane protein assembly factor BamB